jgi:hypothetical protein
MSNLARRVAAALGGFLGLGRLATQIEETKILLGRMCAERVRELGPKQPLARTEFKVFSQFGEDGILQYLVRHLDLQGDRRVFIEFGVGDYEESNTRFLLMNDNWRGLILDGSETNIAYVRRQPWYWRYDLTAACAFVTAENIEGLITGNGFAGELGILSIDIDGNDYWVWQAIECVRPAIVVVEYNSLFGPDLPVTIPYSPEFIRSKAHFSNLYWGASLAALADLAARKGYVCVGSNSAGNNAFFVREDMQAPFTALSPRAAYVASRFREARDANGALSYVPASERLRLLRDLPLHHVKEGRNFSIGELYGV